MTMPDFNARPFEMKSTDQAGIDEAAAQWVKRRDLGLTLSEREEFRTWLAQDSRNTDAFAKADTKADEFDWPWHTGTVDQVSAGLEMRARKRRWRRSVAALGGMAALVAMGCFWKTKLGSPVETLAAPHTAITLPARQVLPDGSVVELKHGARISLAFTDALRRVTLLSGTAYFEVAKNRLRPFMVDADGIHVQAVGTAFAVQLGQSAVDVLVTEGRVAVDQPQPGSDSSAHGADTPLQHHHLFVDAGCAVAIPNASTADRSMAVRAMPESERDERLDWREPRLGFSGTPLAEVVAVMNQHNRVHFVIADPSLEQLRLSGVLRADKVDALVQLLESDFGVSAEYRSDSEIVLRKAP